MKIQIEFNKRRFGRGKVVAFVDNFPPFRFCSESVAVLEKYGCKYDSGWNGSYHDPFYWKSKIFCLARRFSTARRKLRKCIAELEVFELDTSRVRMEARAARYLGD